MELFTEPKKTDLDRDVLKPMIGEGALFCYDSPEYVKDVGTPDRFFEVERDILSGRVKSMNLENRQKAIFLDRDGTINKYVGFLRNIEDMALIDGAANAIKKINQSGYLAIVITNQPIIARGDTTWNELHEINNKMETLLGEHGAYLDDIFICPHHPDKGFDGERKEYKIVCDCRKPQPGLLYQAADKYNIALSESWMVGDSESDMLAGLAANCKVAYLDTDCVEAVYDTFPDLYSFTDSIFK
jgi:D-glycero-D-manno-heptose 1,7-bisphosphate phosphatase